MTTRERLAQALHEVGLFTMEGRAREGYYDDVHSPLALPITQLVIDLEREGEVDLALRACQGEWDSTPAEMKAWAKAHADEWF